LLSTCAELATHKKKPGRKGQKAAEPGTLGQPDSSENDRLTCPRSSTALLANCHLRRDSECKSQAGGAALRKRAENRIPCFDGH
jgi:hypothetical protein